MNLIRRILNTNFFIKFRSWEYWPFGIIQAPLFLYWLILSARERSLFYFSASNPGILTGGMLGESKYEVLLRVPAHVKPTTVLIRQPAFTEKVLTSLRENGLIFPLIFKPDFGERGWMVRRIQTEADVQHYVDEIKIDFVVQPLVDLPLEFGVFYRRFPNEESGRVTSIVGKEMLYVTGDGKTKVQQLIQSKERAKLQWATLRIAYRDHLDKVLSAGERLELVSIGNHCLGTKFLNANGLITEKLSASFDRISKQVDGFYFGRYDVRTASIEDLENGVVQVLELNGCGAEPAHIYDPGFSLWQAVRVLLTHWSDIHTISAQNHARGVPYLSFSEGRAIYKRFKSQIAQG